MVSASLAADIHTTVPFVWALRLWIQQLTLRLLCILTVEQRPLIFCLRGSAHHMSKNRSRMTHKSRSSRKYFDLWATPAWTSTPRRSNGFQGAALMLWQHFLDKGMHILWTFAVPWWRSHEFGDNHCTANTSIILYGWRNLGENLVCGHPADFLALFVRLY